MSGLASNFKMPTTEAETSVFIRGHSSSLQRGSVSARPILTSSTSSMTTASGSVYLARSPKVLLGLVVVLVLIAVITVIVLLSRQSLPHKDSFSDPMCRFGRRHHFRSYASIHSKCGKRINLINECSGVGANAWKYFEAHTSDWNSTIRMNSSSAYRNHSALLVSPTYNFSQSCSLQISLNLRQRSSFKVFVVSQTARRIEINMTSGQCHHGVIVGHDMLKEMTRFQVVVALKAPLKFKEILASVTSHKCFQYQSIDFDPTTTSKPGFEFVPQGRRNLCSLEIVDGNVECDWYDVVGLGNENFEWMETHSCVFRGVSYERADTLSWFLTLKVTHNITRGYVISPIIQGGKSHLILSFWYIAQCGGSKIRVFVVPSAQDVAGVLKNIPPAFEIRENRASMKWMLNVTEIPIPQEYKSFQIVVEGVVLKNAPCEGHHCHVKDLNRKEVTSPLLAIDDLAFEMRNDQCNLTDLKKTENIDCSFQVGNETSTSTMCSWTSSTKNSQKDSFHWIPDDHPNKPKRVYGAKERHFKDRGHILIFNARGLTNNQAYIRSPRLISNSNCSCVMQFLYLLYGTFAPRLQVNLVYQAGARPGSISLEPQWSLFDHQSDEWMLSTVPLNLQSSVPFQVEIRVKDVRDGRSDAHIDDIVFKDCDFRLYKDE